MAGKNGVVPVGSRDRGASPIVGIALLFGLVFLGAALVFISGSAMIDALESEADRERLSLCVDETDHRLGTVAGTGHEMPLDFDDPNCRSDLVEDGAVEVVWYNSSAAPPDWNTNVSSELNALEFESNGQTVAHQGGGIWEASDDDVRVISDPAIQYDNESLQFNLLTLDEGDLEGSTPIARADHDQASNFSRQVMDARGNHTDVAFRVESSYHEGWNRSLRETLGADVHSSVHVDHDPGNQRVEVRIEGVWEEYDEPELAVVRDEGLKGPSGNPIDPQVLDDSSPVFRLGGVVENVGDDPVSQTVTGSIFDPSGTEVLTNTTTVSLDPGDPEHHLGDPGGGHLQFQPGDYNAALEYGTVYEYTIETEDDELDDPGSFYYGTTDSSFNVTDVDVSNDGTGNATIAVEVQNRGVQNDTQDVFLEFDDPVSLNSTQSLSVEYGGTGTVEWTVNRSALPIGSNSFTVETDDDDGSGAVDGTGFGGADQFVVVDRGIEPDQIVEYGEPFTVESQVFSTYEDEQTRDVTLTIPDAGIDTSQSVTLESGGNETVEFDVFAEEYEADLEPGGVYEYDLETDGYSLASPGTFQVRMPDAHFEVSNGSASTDEDLSIDFDLQNAGNQSGVGEVTLELEYLDGETPEEYAPVTETTGTFEPGQEARIEWPLNQSRLLEGDYEATITADGEPETVEFEVTAGIDDGATGIAADQPIAGNVTVLGTQVSVLEESGGWWGGPDSHIMIPTTLQVVAESDGERFVLHEFGNQYGGNNINTYDSWQQKGDDEWTAPFEIEEDHLVGDQVNLTLTATSEQCVSSFSCSFDEVDSDGGVDHYYKHDVDSEWISVDASTDRSEQNVRVRSQTRNTVPELSPYHELQESADETLERHGLWDHQTQTLDLDENEYVFLFEITAETNEDGVDALWNQAQSIEGEGDPNFNDVMVYVEVERAQIDPQNPYLTLTPEYGDEPDLSPGDGDGTGDPAEPGLEIGDVTDGGAVDLSPGTSNPTAPGGERYGSGVDLDPDAIVIG